MHSTLRPQPSFNTLLTTTAATPVRKLAEQSTAPQTTLWHPDVRDSVSFQCILANLPAKCFYNRAERPTCFKATSILPPSTARTREVHSYITTRHHHSSRTSPPPSLSPAPTRQNQETPSHRPNPAALVPSGTAQPLGASAGVPVPPTVRFPCVVH